MRWEQHWNSKQVIYNRRKIHSELIHDAPIQVGALRNIFLHTIFQQNPHENIQTTNSSNTSTMLDSSDSDICICNVAGNTKVQKWSTTTWLIRCYNVAPMKSTWLCFAWKKAQNQNAMSHHFANGNFRYWSRSLRISEQQSRRKVGSKARAASQFINQVRKVFVPISRAQEDHTK